MNSHWLQRMKFCCVLIAGGVLANSLAIATDAAHLLTDFASFMISLFAIYLASRPATKSMSFGWHRAGTEIFEIKHETYLCATHIFYAQNECQTKRCSRHENCFFSIHILPSTIFDEKIDREENNEILKVQWPPLTLTLLHLLLDCNFGVPNFFCFERTMFSWN